MNFNSSGTSVITRCVRICFFLAVLLLFAGVTHAQSLPTGALAGCTRSGSTYTCNSNIVYPNNTTYTLTGNTAITVSGNFEASQSFTVVTNGFTLTLTVTGNIDLKGSTNLGATVNISSNGSFKTANNAVINGNLSVGGDVDVGTNGTINGNITANGNIKLGNGTVVNGSCNKSPSGGGTCKNNQTITFGAQTTPRTYAVGGTFAINPTATASSGLAVTYSSTTATICTVSGTTVTMTAASGTCTIAANQAGNSTYSAAPQVTQSVVIDPLLLSDWRMDETTAYAGVAGEVTNNVSGGTNGTARRSANNLPLTAAFPGNISGKLCGGVGFNGVNYFEVAGLSSQLSGTASLSFWVNTTQIGTNSSWTSPGVTGVEQGGGGNDIFWGWINATGKMALNKGNTLGAQSTSSINDGTWRHIVLSRNQSTGETKIYVNGVLESTRNSETGLVTTAFSSLGRMLNARNLSGALDEVKVFAPVLSNTQVLSIYANESAGKNWDGSARVCPVSGPHHLEILHASGTGLTCAASTLTVRACADAACTALYTGGVSGTLTATGTPTVNWDGTTGGAAGAGFVIASGASSVTKNVQVASVGTVVFATSSPLSPAASSATTCNFGSPSCTFTASSAGFLFSNTATGNTFTIPPQVAGTATAANAVFLRAVQSASTTAAVCTPAIISQNGVGVTMGYSCNNPSSCQPGSLLTVNATAVPPSGGSVSMNFDANGSSPITLNYADVGQITVTASKSITPTGGTSVTLNGSSNAFVVAPAKFAISGVTAGPIKAGANFAATVTAQTSGSVATPNFGKESIPEGATLTRTKYQPTGTNSVSGTLSGSLGSFNSGEATASALAYTEVGSIDLTATLTSGSYLGSGLTATGNTGSTGAVGAFIPDHFDTTVTPGCGTFTYAGQPFAFTVTARNASNATTLNYDGTVNTSPNFAKVVTLSEGNATGAGSYSFTSLAASNFNQGVASYSVAAATPFSFSLTNQTTALPATTALATPTIKLRAVDTDGVSSNSPSTPTEGTTQIRRGRLRLSNAFGSEKSALSLPLQAQYWTGNTWILNSADSCTSIAPANVALSGYTGAITGTTASAVTLSSGAGNLSLSVPTPANATGSVFVAINLGATTTDVSCLASHPASMGASKAWLRAQNGNCAATYDRDPSASATFGIYVPETKKIFHVREQF